MTEEEVKEILNEMIDEIDDQLKKENLLKEFQDLSSQVEQRLQFIENTERQLDRWRDRQLQKNRIFWDGQFFFLPFPHLSFSSKNIVDKLRIILHHVFEVFNMNIQRIKSF